MPPTRALVVGRFQPVHNGHLAALRHIAREFDEVVVAIGSANVSHSLLNPFTAGERFEMLHAALRDAGVANALVVPVQDMNRNALWVSHVVSIVPRFQVMFTNNALPARLFAEAGYEVRPIPFEERKRFEGTHIRELMATGGAWEELVPPAVARVVAEVRGVERIRALRADDSARGR